MKNDRLLWALGIALLIAGGGTAVYSMTRGLRNNNPGNIRHGDDWQGMSATQSDPAFVSFESPLWGIRAMMKVLLNYSARGLDTVQDIISTWAPPTENNTGAYIQSVAAALNVLPGTEINLNEPVTLIALAKAITRHENGINPYSDADFARAFAMT